jgi:hypothetical protein
MSNGQDDARHDKEADVAIAAVSKELDADVFFFCGPLRSPGDQEFVELVNNECDKPNALLVLTTFGGTAESAYRVARCLQRHYPDGKIVLFIDSYCKSAGTLIALGVDEIIMSEGAELGPLDVQLSKPDELDEWMSGLTPIQALSTLRTEAFKTWEHFFLNIRRRSGYHITTRTAANIAARLATGLFSRIYEQLDPMRLGEYGLAMLIAENYGIRLARKNLKDETLGRLIADYPTHEFVIDREEAQDLFSNVRQPTENEAEMGRLMRPLVDAWLKNSTRTIIEHLSSEQHEASEGDQHDEVEPGPGQVPSAAGAGDGQPSGESNLKPTGPSPNQTDKKGVTVRGSRKMR